MSAHTRAHRTDVQGMTQVDVDWAALAALAGRAAKEAEHAGVPCAARPATGFWHLDGPCRCFVGGPPPEYPAVPTQRRADPSA